MLPLGIKGIIHPNIIIMSLFTRCHVLICILVLNTNEDVLKNGFPNDFDRKKILTFFKIYFMVYRRKKLIEV